MAACMAQLQVHACTAQLHLLSLACAAPAAPSTAATHHGVPPAGRGPGRPTCCWWRRRSCSLPSHGEWTARVGGGLPWCDRCTVCDETALHGGVGLSRATAAEQMRPVLRGRPHAIMKAADAAGCALEQAPARATSPTFPCSVCFEPAQAGLQPRRGGRGGPRWAHPRLQRQSVYAGGPALLHLSVCASGEAGVDRRACLAALSWAQGKNTVQRRL